MIFIVIELLDFDEEMIKILTSCGWSQERQVDISAWVERMCALGLGAPHTIASSLLRSLGGLRVVPRTNEGCAYYSAPVTFDPLLEGPTTVDDLVAWGNELSLFLYPTGLTDDDIRLAVSENGSIYGVMSNMVCCYGENLYHSMKCLLIAETKPNRKKGT